jgi:hypothetical protein
MSIQDKAIIQKQIDEAIMPIQDEAIIQKQIDKEYYVYLGLGIVAFIGLIIFLAVTMGSESTTPVLIGTPTTTVPYSSLGCYNDINDNRALRNRVSGAHTIESCAEYAKTKNSKIFGMQYGNVCLIDSDPTRDYKMHGAVACSTRSSYPTGSGDSFLNEIYQLN